MAACTGDRPGVTKHLQAVQLDKGITLLDSPGVVVGSAADGVTSEAGCNGVAQFTCFQSLFTSTKYKH
jgi:ribosome biogenesis GTPase A